MSSLSYNAVALLAGPVTVNLQNGDGKSIIYTVPPGKKAIPVLVLIRNPTASLAGGTDLDLGDGVNADTWVNTVNLSTMTASTDFMVIDGSGTKYAVLDAGDEFGVKPVTGATADADASAYLFGLEFDA